MFLSFGVKLDHRYPQQAQHKAQVAEVLKEERETTASNTPERRREVV